MTRASREIKSIRIDLRPHDFGDGGLLELRTSIIVGDMKHTITQAVTEDDLTSRFEYYFDSAKRSLRDAIEQAQSAGAVDPVGEKVTSGPRA